VKGDSKVDVFGIAAIIVATFASLWLFGLADNVFNFIIEVTNEYQFTNYSPTPLVSNLIPAKNEIPDELPQLVEQEKINEDIVNLPKEQEEIKSEQIPKEILIPSSVPVKEKPIHISKISEEEKIKQRIAFLENQKFTLVGYGIAWEGAPHVSTPTTLSLKLKPIANTELTKFAITEGSIKIKNSGINLNSGNVIIDGDKISIFIEQKKPSDPYVEMTGTMPKSIIDELDQTIEIKFENELLYLFKDDKTPYHLVIESVLKY